MLTQKHCQKLNLKKSCIKNKFIGEGGKPKLNIMEICLQENIKNLLMKIFIEKPFDSLNYASTINVLKKKMIFRKILLSGLNFY